MTAAASATLSDPATHAAAASPMLCPITRSGRSPNDRHSAASATSIAQMAGWIASMSSKT